MNSPLYGHPSSQLKCMNVFPFTPDTLTDQAKGGFLSSSLLVDFKCTLVINGASLILNLIAWTRHFNLSALIFYLKSYKQTELRSMRRER